MAPLLKQGYPPLLPVFACLSLGVALALHPTALPAGTGVLALLFFLWAAALLMFLSLPAALASVAAGIWGVLHMSGILLPQNPLPSVERFADNRPYTITGHVVSFADPGFGRTRYVVSCHTLIPEDTPTPVDVRGRIYLSVYTKEGETPDLLLYGTSIRIRARLKPVRNFANPGGFDYRRFLKFKGITATAWVRAASVHKAPVSGRGPPGYLVLQAIQKARETARRFIFSRAGEDAASPGTLESRKADAAAVLSAMVLGYKGGVSNSLKDGFARAGVSHLLSISGLHLSIIAAFSYLIFLQCFRPFTGMVSRGLARKTALVLTVLPLCLYAAFSGFSPATQRALVMAGVFIAAMALEQETDPLNTLCLAGILILSLDPPALFSISFQLSFAAVAGIIIGMTWVGRRQMLPENPLLKRITGAFWVSLFAGVATFPLTSHYFNTASFIFVLSNLVLVPVMGMVCLPGGIAAVLLSVVFPQAAGGLLALVLELLHLSLALIELLADLPLAWTRVVTPTWTEIGMACLFLAGLAAWLYQRRKVGMVLLGVALAGSVYFTATAVRQRFYPGQLFVTVLDVGQGASALVLTPEGKTILMDCGGVYSRSGFNVGRYVVGPYLWRNRIKTIDLLILSHPQSDHMNGLAFILENFRVKRWICNRDAASVRGMTPLLNLAEKKEIEVQYPELPAMRLGLGQVRVTVYPPEDPAADLNHNSLVCRLEFNAFSMLFTGDIDADREQQLCSVPLASRVMVAPHHGSRSSSSKIFLDHVNPESVIVSCGYLNRYGFPHGPVLNRYRARQIKTYRTDTNGAVIITGRGSGYQITTRRN